MHRTIRGWFAAAALLALSTAIACAQAPDGPPPGPPPDGVGQDSITDHAPGPQRELKMLTRLLSLTTDQQTGVKSILEQQATELRALRTRSQSNSEESNTPEAFQARMAKAEQIRDENNTKIAALLDDGQKKTFAAWVAKRKADMERRRQQGNGDGPPPPPDGGGGPPPGE
jgi:Spy/CpxP family protein refolding chaperone